MATGLVVNQTQVYFGPSSTLYPHENCYAGPNDTVDVLWKEGGWYYIEYPAGSTRKRMYIDENAVTNISGSVSNYTANLQTRYVHTADKTYWGPGTDYPQAGSVSYAETVSYVSPKREGDYVLIEYAVSGGKKKRAYIHGNSLGTSAPTTDKIMIDPISKEIFAGFNKPDEHSDYPVPTGTPVYAMCDGTFYFGYSWGKYTSTSPISYLSLGRGYRLIPDSGWKTSDGITANYIEYGHLSALDGYPTPNYVEQCPGSTHSNCYQITTTTLAQVHVTCGDLIGYSGNSGNSYGPHFHIQFR